MRRYLSIALVALAACTALPATHAFAQYGGGTGGARGAPSDDDSKKRDAEDYALTQRQLDLPGRKNAGPCPYVKVLYDAARYVEFRGDRVASDAVGYTGEIQNLSSGCEYRTLDPIHVEMNILFQFGRGPAAQGSSKDFTYWVAVTDRDHAVIDKEYFTVRANFPAGQDRVAVTDTVAGISIPRAGSSVSGGNFEVLVGFDVTPQMADFNRQGKRFRVNAGSATASQ